MATAECDGLTDISEELKLFAERNSIDTSVFSIELPRYVRIREGSLTREELAEQIGGDVEPVPWLQGFYSIDRKFSIYNTNAYKHGLVYGMEASSGAAVLALCVEQGHHVIDLCCAPGAKLCMIAEMMRKNGTLTGVDISKNRLGICNNILRKYGILTSDALQPLERKRHRSDSEEKWFCRTFVGDGSQFNAAPAFQDIPYLAEGVLGVIEPGVSSQCYRKFRGKKKWKKQLKKRVRSHFEQLIPKHEKIEDSMDLIELAQHCNIPQGEGCYDRVLVDAECTHDGSIKHVQKRETLGGWKKGTQSILMDENTHEIEFGVENTESSYLSNIEESHLIGKQEQLLRNGFRLLKSGGLLVYSTCSLSEAQNEQVIQRWMESEPRAILSPLVRQKNEHVTFEQSNELSLLLRDGPWIEGGIPGTIRFDPITSKTGGLFIARFTKS